MFALDKRAMTSGTSSAAFVEGERHLRSGRFEAAVTAFEHAVALDSTMSRAQLQLAVATLWADMPGERIDAQLARALSHRAGLTELDRTLLDGLIAWRRGEWHLAEGIYRRALAGHPASVAARHELGEVLFHYNAPQGRSIDEARAEFELVLTEEPRHYGALWHLALLAAQDHRSQDVMELTRRLLDLQPDAVRTLEVEAVRAAATHDQVALDRLLDRLRDVDESLLFSVGWRMAVFSRDLAAASRIFSLLTASSRGPYARALGHMNLLYLDVASGRQGAIPARLAALSQLRNTGLTVDWLSVMAAVSSTDEVPVLRLASLRDSLAIFVGSDAAPGAQQPPNIALLTTFGALCALLGDTATARAVADRLDHPTPGATTSATLSASRAATVRALLARQAGKPNDVVRWTNKVAEFRWFANTVADPLSAWSLDRFIRAEALLSLGRLDEADAWFATIGDHDASDLTFLPAALRHRAQIAGNRGDRLAAERLQRRVAELRSVTP
jgi:tetratricopeptide (TPR) repeat protein